MFGRKKNQQEPEVRDTQAVVPAQKKKKKKDTMASILAETVVETNLDEMRSNKRFITEKDGTIRYVGLLLRAEDIGGLNKKSNRDEDKGAIIECINTGRIRVMITPDMLDAEEMVIIPDALTCDAMDEFTLLTDAPYHVALVSDDGSVERTNCKMTMAEAQAIVTEKTTLAEVLEANGVELVKDEDPKDEPEETPMVDDALEEDSSDDLSEIPDELPSEEEPSYDDDLPFFDTDSSEDAPEEPEEELEEETAAFTPQYDDEEVEEDEDEAEAEPFDEVLYDEVTEQYKKTLERLFYSDDLGLVVDTEAFDTQFMTDNPFIPFNEDYGEGWLNEQLTIMAREANNDLEKRHIEDIRGLRRKYFALLSIHAESVMQRLDADNVDTDMGQKMQALKDEYDQNCDNMEDAVREKQKELTDTWEKEMQDAADAAAQQARQSYQTRHDREHTAALTNVESRVRQDVKDAYDDKVRELTQERKNIAKREMDYGTTTILEQASTEYLTLMTEEQNLYRAYREKMERFRDDHRKDEQVRIETLQEELRQSDKADRVMAEFTAKLQQQTEEFAAKRQILQAEMEATERKAAQTVNQKELECNARIAEAKKENERLQSEIDNLMAKYAELDEKKDAEYRSRIQEAQDEKIASEEKCQHIITTHKRSNAAMVALTIVLAVATLAIGVLIGMSQGIVK